MSLVERSNGYEWVGMCITSVLVEQERAVNIYIIALAEGAPPLFIYLLNISNDNRRCQCNTLFTACC